MMGAVNICYGQYMNKMYDCDSNYDWGWNIFVEPSGNYFIFNISENNSNEWSAINLEISADGGVN
jgi:hypothetical protein